MLAVTAIAAGDSNKVNPIERSQPMYDVIRLSPQLLSHCDSSNAAERAQSRNSGTQAQSNRPTCCTLFLCMSNRDQVSKTPSNQQPHWSKHNMWKASP